MAYSTLGTVSIFNPATYIWANKVNSNFEDHEGRIGTLETDSTSLQSDVDQLYLDTTANTDDIIQLYSDTTANADDITQLYTDTSANAADIVQLYTDTSANAADIIQLYSDTTANADDIVQLYIDTTANADDITQLYIDTTANADAIAILQEDMTSDGWDFVSVTSDTTVSGPGKFVLIDSDTSAVNATLPPAATCIGKQIGLKVTSYTNAITVYPDGSESIDGASSFAGLTAASKSIIVASDGTGWWIIAGYLE